ncbi:MAG: VCBS repeat-containing protein, partial [Phenylobacterium sp.]
MLKLDGQFATGIQPNDIVAGDFDGDGRVDLAVGHRNPNMVRLWFGVGDGGFASPSDLAVGINNLGWSAAD